MIELIQSYLAEIEKQYKSGHATEHSYRPALQNLIEGINSKIHAVNEPKKQKVGAPELTISIFDIRNNLDLIT